MSAEPKSVLGTVTPTVLMNLGVPVDFYRTKVVNNEHQADADEKVEHRLKFDNWKLSVLEEQFTSMQKWDESMNSRPFQTTIRTIALLLDWAPQRVASAMPTGHIAEYQLAVHAALQIALGSDPKRVARALNETLGEETAAGTASLPPVAPSETTDASHGTSSGAHGSAQAETPTSSGDAPQASAWPSSTPWPS